MWMPVFCSTVLTSSFGPPNANAALIFVVPCPGIGTSESRGIDMVSVGPLPVWTSTMVSVRWPAALPVWSFLRCSA